MKNERLFDAIGQIDEEFIDEADPEKKQESKKKIRVKGWRKIGALAACVCIVIFIALPDENKSSTGVGDLESSQNTNGIVEGQEAEAGNTNQDAKVETMTHMEKIQIEILNVQSEGFVGTVIVGTDIFNEGEKVTVLFQENVTVIDEDGNHFEYMAEEPNADSSGYEVGTSVWISFQAYEYQIGSEYNRVYAYHVEPGKNSSITSDTEPMEEYCFEEALNDEQFGEFLPTGIIKGYELQEQVKIYNRTVLKAKFYNSGFNDELTIRIAEKEWFYEENEDIILNTVMYEEKNGRTVSYIFIDCGDTIVWYSFSNTDIAVNNEFFDMVYSASYFGVCEELPDIEVAE